MTNAAIETFSGKWFDILDPQPDQVDIESIAHALSMLCRFTGHVRHFYSVAQHSWLGSYLVPEGHELEFLLHDASEAFIGDMSRPLKHLTAAGGSYREVEENVMRVIRKKFNLPAVQSAVIHEIDNEMLWAEKVQLMGSLSWSPESITACECPDNKQADVQIYPMYPDKIEKAFLSRFHALQTKGAIKICQS